MGRSSRFESDSKVLVTDFDGTLTARDFYQLVVARLLPPDTPDYWAAYRAGRLTHFEALNAYFAAARPDASALDRIVADMGLAPGLRGDIEMLADAGWRVVVASAGCSWYIDRLLAEAGVELEVHANPGRVVDGRLLMELSVDSPYFSPDTGIDKAGIVREALARARAVTFAGDGPPDLAPALLVPPATRFARGHLAEALAEHGEAFHRFEHWSEVARALVSRDASAQ